MEEALKRKRTEKAVERAEASFADHLGDVKKNKDEIAELEK